MDKIFEMLNIDKLDESKQNELKETLRTVIELKAQDIAEAKVSDLVKEEKEKLAEKYEAKFDEYKGTVTSKFSGFVDNVLDEEMTIPKNVIKYAKLGELYHDLVEQFKTRLAIDEGMIDSEVQGMLKEAKEEITSLRSKVDESTGKIMDLESDASEMAAKLYIQEKVSGMTESQKAKVVSLLGDEIVKENIDKKFDTIVESLNLLEGNDDDDDDDDDDKKTFEAVCEDCGNKETLKEDSDMKCPECGGKMGKVKVDESTNNSSKNPLNENGPLAAYKNIWLNALKTE